MRVDGPIAHVRPLPPRQVDKLLAAQHPPLPADQRAQQPELEGGHVHRPARVPDLRAVEIHFAHDPHHKAETSDHAAYIRTDDVDGWSDEIAKLGLPAQGRPAFKPAEDKDWGMRELHMLDPDGHLIRVGQFIDG